MPHSIVTSGPSAFVVQGNCVVPLHVALDSSSITRGGNSSLLSALMSSAISMPQASASACLAHGASLKSPSMTTLTSSPAWVAIFPPGFGCDEAHGGGHVRVPYLLHCGRNSSTRIGCAGSPTGQFRQRSARHTITNSTQNLQQHHNDQRVAQEALVVVSPQAPKSKETERQEERSGPTGNQRRFQCNNSSQSQDKGA